MLGHERKNQFKKSKFDIFQFVILYFSCVNWESEITQIFPKFKIFETKLGHLEQKLDLTNQNRCEKFLKNNAYILTIIKIIEMN
jgi:hypothetical protein